MAIEIQSGDTAASKMKVDSKGRALVLAVSETEDFFINKEDGKVWSVPFEGLNPAGADDFVVYIKNTGNNNINITDIRVSADTIATQLSIHKVTGTASGGSAITPVPRNLGSAEIPTATIESGTDITGLTDGGVLFFIQCAVTDTTYHLRTSSNIILTKGS